MSKKLPKIIVTTGCSYGKFHSAFDSALNKDIVNTPLYENLEFVVDLHSQSMGSKFQIISVIETVDKLISSGAEPNDIFVICEFSEINRNDIVIQNEFLVNEIDNAILYENVNGKEVKRSNIEYPDTKILKHSDYTKKHLENLKLKKFPAGDYPKFNNYYIINPEKRQQPIFPNRIVQSVLDIYVKSMDITVSAYDTMIDRVNIENINRGIIYFQNILTLQNYLNSKGIEYKFCLMNNQFSMYSENGLQTHKRTKKLNGEHYLYQDYVNSKQIWEINSMIRILYEMVDWSKWWFYENKDKNIIFGGIDEYAIDKYGVSCYDSRNNDANLFGQHPQNYVYWPILMDEMMKEYF